MSARLPNFLAILALTVSPALLLAQRGGATGGPLKACQAQNRNLLTKVETNFASVRMSKGDQTRYNALLAPIRGVGPTPADCQANTPRITELGKVVDAMVTRAKASPVRVETDRSLGGVIVDVDTSGRRGVVSALEDIPSMGNSGMWFGAAEAACQNLVTGGFSDWYLPTMAELGQVWKHRAILGQFQTRNYGYWSSSRLFQQDHKVHWLRWSDASSNWSDIENTGPTRSLLNARCVRKF